MSSKRILFLTQASAVTRIFPQLREAEIEASLAENVKGASAFVRSSSPQFIISRPSLPGYKAEELLAEAENNPNFPRIVILVDEGNPDEARHFMDLGAYDYWTGALSSEKLVALLSKNSSSTRKQDKEFAPQIVGSSSAMRRVLALAKQVAPSKATILINGESGTGKEMFSKNIHGWSDRASAPFIAINCAALPEHLLESELFGHEKGSFTGAIGKKVGKFELASGGTLLLDEISEMDIALQAKLLRALQEGEIDRVGGTETVKVDVRVIATTNRNLEDWVKQGKFRQDLYFRLNVIPLRLPSLHERGNDILELANFFLDMYTKEYQIPKATFSAEAVTWIKGFAWPGNVRELQNLMERAVLLAAGNPIKPSHFLLDLDNWPLFGDESYDTEDSINDNDIRDTEELQNEQSSVNPINSNDSIHNSKDSKFREQSENVKSVQTSGVVQNHEIPIIHADDMGNAIAVNHAGDTIDLQSNTSTSTQPTQNTDDFSGALMPLHEVERLMIKKGLQVTSGNRTQAAELLGISVRTLRNKLNEYKSLGLEVE